MVGTVLIRGTYPIRWPNLFGLKMSSVVLLLLVAGCAIFSLLSACCFMQHCSQLFLHLVFMVLVLVGLPPTLLLKFPLLKIFFGITVGILGALALIRCSCLVGDAHVSSCILLFGLKMLSVILLVLVAGCVVYSLLSVCCFMQHCSQIILRLVFMVLVLVGLPPTLLLKFPLLNFFLGLR